ncbi:hypothetical protein [Bacillus weihaiensis]|uniref:hypothetical protein n=1 Tax=Bacillus weihaiensis TaxID=1547283 RepID=UPI0023558750|nr:hypothetical protein [Bacillus weihaiensis]
MTRDEILQLFVEKKKKRLTNKMLADSIGCSASLISHFFNFQCNLSEQKEIELKRIIRDAKEYRTVTIPID